MGKTGLELKLDTLINLIENRLKEQYGEEGYKKLLPKIKRKAKMHSLIFRMKLKYDSLLNWYNSL